MVSLSETTYHHLIPEFTTSPSQKTMAAESQGNKPETPVNDSLTQEKITQLEVRALMMNF
jgi:hypothetical protein